MNISRDSSFAMLQNSFSSCSLTEEEIRQECEAARLEIYKKYYEHK